MPKPLYTKDMTCSILHNILNITKNTRTFTEKVKIIFMQKGYISKGLAAKVVVNKVPLSFSA